MKKILGAMVIAIFCCTLVGCGTKDEKKSDKKENGKEQVEKSEDIINDNDTYYVKIDGKKYSVGDKISSISQSGYYQDADKLKQELPGNKYMIGGGDMHNADDDWVFDVTPFNVKSSAVPLSEAVIGGLSLRESTCSTECDKFEVYGGIKIGSTIAELEKVFGKGEASTYGVYRYASDEVYRNFKFTTEDGKVTGIDWQNLVFNK